MDVLKFLCGAVCRCSWEDVNKSLLTLDRDLITYQRTKEQKVQLGEAVNFIMGYLEEYG